MTPCTSAQSSLALHKAWVPKWSSTQVLNTLQWQELCVVTKQQASTGLNMLLSFQKPLIWNKNSSNLVSKMRITTTDASLRLTTCSLQLLGRLSATRALQFCTALLNYRASCGKITLAFNLWTSLEKRPCWLMEAIWRKSLTKTGTTTQFKEKSPSLRRLTSSNTSTSALTSSSWPCSRTVDLAQRQTVF